MSVRALGQDSLVGLDLGHYRIVEKIGAGGMGEVYRARDQHLPRDVAIKVLPPGTLIDESDRKHFHKEALILSQLNHPNVATIHDFDTQQGVDFLVMEYVPGITLSDKVAAGPLPEKEILRLGEQLAEGLSAAHQHGVVHRDLKPGNLRLTDDGRLKILDFGLAMLRRPIADSASTETLGDTQSLAGTLPYMTPEQLLGEEVDARTDIHAAGAVLYAMATGQRPFANVELSQLIGAILHRPPLPPTTLNPILSPELERIIEKCLEKEPENRYQSAKELAVDMRRLERDKDAGHIAAEALQGTSRGSLFPRRWRPIAAAAAIVAMLLLIAAFWLARRKTVPGTAQITPSIAVLPFVDLSPDKNQEYFSDGLAEELLSSLVKIQGLHVVARTSSFQFKGKNEDLRVVGQKLNVATVLEGSVRKQGQRVRISAQLVQASDGFHLWSETYDRDLTDIFAVQEEIARSVVASLRVTLLGEKVHSPRATSVEAYNAYLQGKYFSSQSAYPRDIRERLEKAIAHYEQAIKLDPNYAPAWAMFSRALRTRADFDNDPLYKEKEFSKAREAAERALALDPNLADAYLAMGFIKQFQDWDWARADAFYRRALALEPGNAVVVGAAAYLAATLNRFDEALRLSRRAVELDPIRPGTQFFLGRVAWWAGRLDEAAAAEQKASELNPDLGLLHNVLARVYLAQSRPQEALVEAERETNPSFRLQGLALAYHALARKPESDRALAELIAKYPGIAASQIAQVYAFRGEADAAFMWLERAYVLRDSGLADIKGDPLLKNLERDPRYAAFLKKIRLPA